MNLENEKTVKETYARLLRVGFGEGAIEEMPQFIAEDVMGYGTALDEKIMSIEEFIKLINNQRKQSKDFDDFQYTSNPVIIRLAENGQSAVIVDEIELVTVIDGKSNLLPLRMSTVMELKNGAWKITHWHGSLAEHVSDGEDPWHITQWKQKTEKLARLVDEKTADLEGKNRELEIEAALERLRSRSMAMHKSEELADLSFELVKQVHALGIDTWFCAFNIYDDDSEGSLEWGSNAQGTYEEYRTPREGIFLRYYKAGQEGETLLINEIDEKECPGHYEYLCSLPGVGEQLLAMKDAGISFPTSQIDHVAFFKYGYIIFITFEPAPEAHDIFKRFAKVFEQTYTRFLDLKKAEFQAREARIETSLERIRATAMSMQKADGLLDVVQILHKELNALGVPEIRNTSINIFDDVNEKFLNYEYSDYNDKTAYEVDYNSHPSNLQFVSKMREHAEDFMITEFTGNDLKEWKKWIKNQGQKLDSALEQAECLYYYDYSIGLGSIGISTFSPISKVHLEILNRIRNVFNLAYRRYADITLAEAQAREAQIELALERIRAQVTAMQESSELLDIVVMMQAEFTKLGHEAHYFWHMRWLPDKYIKALTNGEGTRIGNVLELPRGFHGLQTMLDWEKTDEPSAVFALDPETAADYIDKMIKLGRFQEIDHSAPGPDEVRDMGGLTFVMARTTHGEIGYTLPGEVPDPPEEDIATLVRFAGVFDLAYRRFEDLKSAEKQNRETQIDLALERVRSKAMAMNSSEDLGLTVDTFFSELKGLNLSPHRCGVGIVDGDTRIVKIQAIDTNPDQESKKIVGDLKLAGHPVLDEIFKHWQSQEEYFPVLHGKEIVEYYKVMNPQVTFHNFADDEVQYGYYFYFKEGGVYAWTDKELQEQDLQIFRKYTSVLSLTYRRYLDLKDAEAKTREAIKQSSLDRIRGQIASMRTATDLHQITPLIWNELKILEVPFFRCGVFIVKDNKKHVQVYLTTPEGKSLGVLDLDIEMSELTRDTVKSWRKKEVYQTHWNRKEFIAWTREMMKLHQIKTPEEYQGDEKPPESLYLHFIPFSQGMLYVGNTEQLENEKIDLVISLAEAFSFAYARYEDFVVLEEAKERVENALSDLKATQTQLIHAEKMASLGELTAGIAHEIQNPLNFINNFSEVNKELITDLQEEIINGNKEEIMAIANDIGQNEDKINHHGKRASSIVKGMLEHSRAGGNQKEPTDINALADEYLKLAYHGLKAKNKTFNAEFKLEAEKNLPKVNVITQDIGRVLLNLINNAFFSVSERKQQPNNGYKPEVIVTIKKLGEEIEISVKDNGKGIPEEIRDKIFQPFFTTKPTGQGTGLGLSMSYDIITKGHGGNIEVRSKTGEGTEFIVRLPVT
jgi:signal transduction histidine kinase